MLALALTLVAPVAGPVTEGFDPGRPFEAGRHRGVDLAAAPGTPVRAACSGEVAFAGRIAGAGIVSVRCGPWRVTHMPLATITARGRVASGTAIGTVAASRDHVGLHVGVRRDGTRFGYVDPVRFLSTSRRPVPLGRAPRSRSSRRPPPRHAPRFVTRPHVVRPPPAVSSPLAPWPAWAGLALALAGAGLSMRLRVRTRSPARRRGSVAA